MARDAGGHPIKGHKRISDEFRKILSESSNINGELQARPYTISNAQRDDGHCRQAWQFFLSSFAEASKICE